MADRHPSAVVFDVWKTLVPLTDDVKRTAFEHTARALGADPAALRGRWTSTRRRRETQPLASYLVWLRDELGADWSPPALDAAMRARREVHGGAFATPTAGAVAILGALRARGLRTAAVSNGTSEVRAMLGGSALGPLLDAIVVSAEAGVMKPHVEIYRHAAARLGVACGDCVYVGDGTDEELVGAEAAGMTPILFDLGEGRPWHGRRITALVDVEAALATPPAAATAQNVDTWTRL